MVRPSERWKLIGLTGRVECNTLGVVPRFAAMVNKPAIIFDTSALNKLADDGDSVALIAGLTSGFTVHLTGTSVDEIAETPCAERRNKLLNLCKRLLSAGDCIQPHDLLRETLISQFSKTSSLDWKTISARFPEYEEEIARQEIINDDVAKKQRDCIRNAEKEFAKLLDDHRPDFDRLYQSGDPTRPAAFGEFLGRLQIEGGAFWTLGIAFYARTTKDRPSEQTIREFVGKCPPFHAFLLAICVAEYERCVRDLRAGRSLRAGKFDLYMSLYLPYCDEFITADEGQLKALQEVVSVGNLGVRVRSYEDLRDGFFGRPSSGPKRRAECVKTGRGAKCGG